VDQDGKVELKDLSWNPEAFEFARKTYQEYKEGDNGVPLTKFAEECEPKDD
jgi:hypothetical protein